MKRFFTYAAVTFVLCSITVSCDKFSGTGKAIGFKVDAKAQATKSAPVTTGSLETDYKAFYSQANVTGGNQYYGKTLTSFSDGSWATGMTWPEDMDTALDFWSYGPVQAFSGVTPSFSVDNSVMTFIYSPAPTASEQQDVIVACTPNRAYNSTNPLVPVDFQHALSAVRFKVGTIDADLDAADKVEITRITLSGVKSEGTCSVSQAAVCTWSPGAATAQYTQTFDTGSLVSGEYLDAKSTDKTIFGEEIFMLIPQTFSGVKATIDWTMDGVSYDARTASLNNVAILPGYIYTFTVSINAREKSVSVELADWIPWEKVDNDIDFDNHVVSAKKLLQYTGCEIDGGSRLVTFSEGNPPITCSFKIDSPLGATFMVSLEKDFDAFEITYPYNRVIVDDEAYECVFTITPKVKNPARDYETTLRISARTADGRVINLDDVVQPQKYTIVLPKSL